MARISISNLPSITSNSPTDVLVVNRSNVTYKQQIGTLLKSYNFNKFFNTLLDIPFNNDLENRQMVGVVSCLRNSVGTTFNNKTGILTKYAINTPRYEQMIDGSFGILRETQKQNFITNSNALTPTTINATATLTNSNVTGPDGITNSADTLTFLGGATSFDVAIDVNPISNSNNMSLSMFIMGGTSTNFVCSVIDTSNNNLIIEQEFVLNTDYDSTKFSRVQLNFISPISNTLRIVLGNYVTGGTITQSNGSVILYGFQLENSQSMTSYIENTTNLPATRNFDDISIPFDNNFPLTHEWTILFDVELPLQDSTNSNSFFDFKGVTGMGFNKSNQYSIQNFKNGGKIDTNVPNGDGTIKRIKLRNTLTECSIWVDDTQMSTTNNLSEIHFNKLVNCTDLSIGGYEGVNDSIMIIRNLKIFNHSFNDDEMRFL